MLRRPSVTVKWSVFSDRAAESEGGSAWTLSGGTKPTDGGLGMDCVSFQISLTK